MRHFFILLFTISLFHMGAAQTDFRPGYVILNSGDSIQGKIDYRGDILMAALCKFKPDGADSVQEYHPNDIAAFRFTDSKFYISKLLPGKETKKVFMEFLIHGEVNIYYYNGEKADRYFIDKKGDPLKEIAYEEGTKQRDEGLFFYQSTKHFGLLKYYMQDTPDLYEEIDGIKKPSHDNLIRLAKDYHKKVCKSYDCIIYEKKLPIIKLNMELSAGLIGYNASFISKNRYLIGGGLIYLWSPRTSEKLFIKTGLVYSAINFEGQSESLLKIPFHLLYLYPKGIIRPKFAYGVNYYPHQGEYTISYTAGVNINLHKNINLSLNADAEFEPTQIIIIAPKSFFALSVMPGIFIKF